MRYGVAFGVAVMVALGGATIPAQQAAAAPEPARLTGIIFADDTGLPISNASVRVLGREFQTTTTGEDGRFEIARVPPGSHLVAAVAAGYAVGTAGQRHPTDTPTLVEFQSRAILSVEIRLTPLGVITGTILDEQGQPAVSAEVVAARTQTRDGCNRGCRTVTDGEGRYRLTGLRDGRYHVMAIAPASRGAARTTTREATSPTPGAPSSVAPPTRPITYYPGTSLPAQSATVSVTAGTQTDASFPLIPGELSRIAGTILDSRGAPVRDYLVMLDARPPQPQSLLPRYIEVGADGRFELKDVPPGDYTLLVRD